MKINTFIKYCLTCLLGMGMILTETGCSRSEAPEPLSDTASSTLIIRAFIGSVPAESSRADGPSIPTTGGWYGNSSDADYNRFLDDNELTNDYENFIGNIRAFLLDGNNNILFTQTFQRSNPDTGEGPLTVGEDGAMTISINLMEALNVTPPNDIFSEAAKIKRIVLVANQPYSADETTNLYFEGLQNRPATTTSFNTYVNKLVDNQIITETELQQCVGRLKRPFGLTMIGGVAGLDLSTADKVKTFNTTQSVLLYRNCSKMVVDVKNALDTDRKKYTRYMGAVLWNIPTKIRLVSKIVGESDLPLWNGFGTNLINPGAQLTRRNDKMPYLVNNDFPNEIYGVPNPGKVRYVFYISAFLFDEATTFQPNMTFYTTQDINVTYTGEDDVVNKASKHYTFRLLGDGTDNHQVFANRLNYFEFTFTGSAIEVENVIFGGTRWVINESTYYVNDNTGDAPAPIG